MATIPSIAMIPSGYKAGKLYSVLPTNGDGDFTVTRNTAATRVNKNGLIEEVASNVPRLDYSDGGCPSLLLEPTSTNLIPYSEDFSDASWIKQPNTTFTYNTTEALSPDGTNNATKAVGNGTDGILTSNVSATGVVARSIYLKSVTGTVNVILKDPNATITEKSLTVTTDWQRFDLVEDNGGSLQGMWIDDIPSSGIYIWGAQLEENSHATSYIKTVGTTQTRTADTASSSGNSTVINSTEGTLFAEISALGDDSVDRYLSISDGTSENRISLWYYSATNGLAVAVYSGSSAQFFATTVLGNDTDFNKIAIKYKINDFALWINGTEISTNISGVTPIGLSELSFNRGDGSPFYGKTKSVQVYTTALTDAELLTLTTI